MGPADAVELPPRRSSWPRWLGTWRADLLIAAVCCLIQISGAYFAAKHQTERRSLDWAAYALLTAGPAALLARRRYPTTVLLVAFGTTLTYWVAGYPRGPVFAALIVAFLGALVSGRRLVAALVALTGWAAFPWLSYEFGHSARPSLGGMLGLAAWLLVLLTLGEAWRVRRVRAGEVARTREEEERRRASEERLRIARELHDVLAHNISLINVQAGVALHLMDEQPEQARTSLAAIKQASKDALSELRSVLDILRRVGEEAPRSPEQGLDRLDELVTKSRATGLRVGVRTEGERRVLPAGVDLAAFRIVQEALTNVTRHAGADAATVRVTYSARDVVVQVDDDGHGSGLATAARTGSGSGIRGMRERATALGGELEAGPRPGGGFRVRARLPLNGAS